MLLDPIWNLLEEEVFSRPSTDDLFNLYRDRNEELDRPGAPQIRRRNLRRYLSRYEERPPFFMLAEAPGPWGCRFSGVPFTSEKQLADDTFPLAGEPSGAHEDLHAEYSGGIYWRVMQPYFPRFFVWNSVPYHPHKEGKPMSIRAPRRSEIKVHTDLLSRLLQVLQPDHLVAVGRKAEYALAQAGRDSVYVRHPSQGGAVRFEEGVRSLFEEQHPADTT